MPNFLVVVFLLIYFSIFSACRTNISGNVYDRKNDQDLAIAQNANSNSNNSLPDINTLSDSESLSFVKSFSFIDKENIWLLLQKTRTLVHTNDGGVKWRTVSLPQNEILESISFISSLLGWVVTDSGVILRTKDGGDTWEKLHEFLKDDDYFANQIHFIDTEHGWIVGYFSVWYTQNGGITWKKSDKTRLSSDGQPRFIFFVNPLKGWFVDGESGGESNIYITIDGGKSWKKQFRAKKSIEHIYFIDDIMGWAVGDGFIYRTFNGGKFWEKIPIKLDNSDTYLLSVKFINNQEGLVSGFLKSTPNSNRFGGKAFVAKTGDGGMNWETIAFGGSDKLIANVEFTDKENIFLVGNTDIKLSNNAGNSWMVLFNNESVNKLK